MKEKEQPTIRPKPVLGLLSLLVPAAAVLASILITTGITGRRVGTEWSAFAPGIVACLVGFPAGIVGCVLGVLALARAERMRILAVVGIVVGVGIAAASAPIALIAVGR